MSRLTNCIDLIYGKLLSKEDADYIKKEAARFQADGDTPIAAARAAAQRALDDAHRQGAHIIEQIRLLRPEGHQAAVDFWNRETIRPAGPLEVQPQPVAAPAPVTAAPVAEAPAAAPAGELQPGDDVVHAQHGPGIFVRYAPDGKAIIQVPHFNTTRFVTTDADQLHHVAEEGTVAPGTVTPEAPAAAPQPVAEAPAAQPAGTVTAYRGEPKGPSPAGHAHGIGEYYGLDEQTAQRFSKAGTVKQTSLSPKNPLVVNSDAELSAIRKEAGVNKDPRMLLSKKEAARFTQYLQGKGYDSFVSNYAEAPGGKQIVVFPTVEAVPAAVEGTAVPGYVKVRQEGERAAALEGKWQALMQRNERPELTPEEAKGFLARLDAAPGDNPQVRAYLQSQLAPEAAAEPAPEPVAEAPAEPPPISGQLNPQAETVIQSAPADQQEGLRAAMAESSRQDSSGPLEDVDGKIAPEENTGMIAELLKYGVFKPGATAKSILQAIVNDTKQPRWMRTIVNLLIKVGAGEGVSIKVVNMPNSNWAALYDSDTGEILINLGQKPAGSLARTLAHEVVHHLTFTKLAGDESALSKTELEAKRGLEKIFQDIIDRPEFKDEYGALNLWEFASEVMSSQELRDKLNKIYPEGSRLSLGQLWRRLIAALGFGDEGVKVGGYLDEAMRNVINVAGHSAGSSKVAALVRGFVAPLARQALTSEKTSRPQVPAAMKQIPWEKGTRNLDLGGGKVRPGNQLFENQGSKESPLRSLQPHRGTQCEGSEGGDHKGDQFSDGPQRAQRDQGAGAP